MSKVSQCSPGVSLPLVRKQIGWDLVSSSCWGEAILLLFLQEWKISSYWEVELYTCIVSQHLQRKVASFTTWSVGINNILLSH